MVRLWIAGLNFRSNSKWPIWIYGLGQSPVICGPVGRPIWGLTQRLVRIPAQRPFCGPSKKAGLNLSSTRRSVWICGSVGKPFRICCTFYFLFSSGFQGEISFLFRSLSFRPLFFLLICGAGWGLAISIIFSFLFVSSLFLFLSSSSSWTGQRKWAGLVWLKRWGSRVRKVGAWARLILASAWVREDL